MATIKDTILKKISEALKKSILKDELDKDCSDITKEVILSTLIKSWLEGNRPDADDQNKDYFKLLSGRLFEHYVVSLLDGLYNPDDKVKKKEIDDGTKKWIVVSWRSDKIQNIYKNNNGFKAETNRYPDIILEFYNKKKGYNGFKNGDRIAIECKWTYHKDKLSIEQCAINRMPNGDFYPKNALKDNACCLYYAIGVGWNITSKKQPRPEAVFFIPANRINNISKKEINNFLVQRKPQLKKKESLINSIVAEEEINEIISDSANKLDNLKKSLGIK